jgi:uncharacterized protein (TIGR00251 family)
MNAENLKTTNRLLQVKVHPGASRNELTGLEGDVLQLKIAAPPEKGKANREMVDFISRLLDIKKSSITIAKGESSHNKFIAIEGLTPDETIKRLSTSFPGLTNNTHEHRPRGKF